MFTKKCVDEPGPFKRALIQRICTKDHLFLGAKETSQLTWLAGEYSSLQVVTIRSLQKVLFPQTNLFGYLLSAR